MKNVGIFLPVKIGIQDLIEIGVSQGGIKISESTFRFGDIPEEAYLNLSTDLSNGCFDDDELKILQAQLGYTPVSYIDIEMNYTKSAFNRAMNIAREVQKRWGGEIDYSGVTGNLENPFQAPS